MKAKTYRTDAEAFLEKLEEIQSQEDKEIFLDAVLRREFNRGYVVACCNVANLHNEETIAADVLGELNVTETEIVGWNLSEYDMRALEKIRRVRSFDPLK